MRNHTFLLRKIKLIQEDLRELEKLAAFSYEELSKDLFQMMATERFLERIVTRAIDINQHLLAKMEEGTYKVRDYHDTFFALADMDVYPKEFAARIAPSVGLRNVLVHEYDEVDERLVYESMHKALEQYSQYCEYLLRFIASDTEKESADRNKG